MTTAGSGVDAIRDPVGSLLEQLLVEVVTGTRLESRGNGSGGIAAALRESVMSSFSRAVARSSEVERVLLAEVLSPALAGLLSPALAHALRPRVVATLSRLAAQEQASGEPEWREGEKSKNDTPANGSIEKDGFN